jgi:hypothetical protein
MQAQVHEEVRHEAHTAVRRRYAGRNRSGRVRVGDQKTVSHDSLRRINTNSTKSTTLTEVREENIMRQRARVLAFFLLVVIGAASPWAQAANLTVNCDKKETIHKAVKLLADTNPQGPNTITVSGS